MKIDENLIIVNEVTKSPGFVNSELFSCEAKAFLANKAKQGKGFYIADPEGSPYQIEYWNEQTRRCLEGYEVGGVRITGPHQFQLNFCPILLQDDSAIGKKRKIESFPKFWDLDYIYFCEFELAQKNGEGIIVAKARRKGFSYKNAAIAAYTYNFFRKSNVIIAAQEHTYSDIPMGMSLTYLNFINQYTAWFKRRSPDTRELVTSRYEYYDGQGRKSWKGYHSTIQKMSFKDNFSKGIGQSVDLMLFEEAGKWPGLIDAYIISEPLFRDGDVAIGTPVIFGTGGDMEKGSVDFSEMFQNPEMQRLRSFKNEWDDDGIRTVCGLFIPDQLCYTTEKGENVPTITNNKRFYTIDSDGNSNIEASKSFLLKKRDHLRKTATKSQWEKFISQSPFNPKEAFLKTGANLFPVAELSEWLGKIETSSTLRNLGKSVDLLWSGDKNKPIKCSPSKRTAILDFPLKSSADREGAIVIYEDPFEDPKTGLVPDNLYIAGTDPVDLDDAPTSTSLPSTLIYKTFNKFGQTFNIIVAEYTGRPETSNEYYENLRKLLTQYNCQTLYENQLKGLKTYFETKKSLHLLKMQPGILSNMVKNSTVNRGYGIHMSKEIKRTAEIYIRDWLVEPRGFDENENPIYNLNHIYSIPLLKELINQDKDSGNFDRVIALMLIMIYSQDNYNVEVKKQNVDSGRVKEFFSKFDSNKKILSNLNRKRSGGSFFN